VEGEDEYDPASIVKAWRSGDATGLTRKNRSILDACAEIIGAVITDGMSDYDKELAIHDWIIDWADYDVETMSNSPDAKPDPNNDNPYGTIYSKKAICSGYTSTFQLFMDLLGVECITVHGFYTRTGGEHAWNMVRIDGEWYCVDVTWNDPIGVLLTPALKHLYFNVTSQFMRDTGHEWDEGTTPVADAGKLYKAEGSGGLSPFLA
jgi:transglutaminase/protease-like cytokinesis protein 3